MSEAILAKPPQIYLDGFGALDGGMDGRDNKSVASKGNPNGLARNQVSFAINSTFRGGLWTHRPIYMRRAMQFPDLNTSVAFCTGYFQGCGVHQATQSSLLTSVSGRLYQILVESGFTVRDITPLAGPHPSNLDYVWHLQAGRYSLFQDGSSPPWIFDGTSVRYPQPNEIKPGGPMGFSQGRIWYAVKDPFDRFTQFRATDLIGQPDDSSVLKETENAVLNGGGNFTSRSDMGEIRAMVVPRMLDTSLGQGPLQVFCERGAMSVQAPVDRAQWLNVTYPIQTESVFDYGALGGRFATKVNDDILYRSLDGFRSFKLSRADYSQWLNTGISMEVDTIIAGDPQAFLFYGSSILFDNRYLATTWPRPTPTGFVHDGIVPLDFNLISSLRGRDQVAWEGVWTGLAIHQLVKGTFAGVERCFAFCRNTQGRTELWEILPMESDEIWDNGLTPIVWSIETPSYDFDSAQRLKRLQTAAIWRTDIQETVQILYQWRPDQHPCYIDWHTETDCAPVRQCSLPRCSTPRNLRPQYRPKVRLPQPPDTCNEVNGSLFRDACEMQFRLQVTGHMKMKMFRPAATDLPEPFFDGCPIAQACNPLDCCSPDPLLYSSAPYHDDGSSGGYPAPVYPNYPVDYPPNPPAQIINPPSGTPGIVPPEPPQLPPPPVPPPGTVQFPNLPPVVLLPQPNNQPPWVGSLVFFGLWTPPTGGPGYEIGTATEPPAGLQDGTYSEWATQLWTQFSDWVGAQGITISQARCYIAFEGSDPGPPSSKHWFADLALQQNVWISSYGLGFALSIEYITP